MGKMQQFYRERVEWLNYFLPQINDAKIYKTKIRKFLNMGDGLTILGVLEDVNLPAVSSYTSKWMINQSPDTNTEFDISLMATMLAELCFFWSVGLTGSRKAKKYRDDASIPKPPDNIGWKDASQEEVIMWVEALVLFHKKKAKVGWEKALVSEGDSKFSQMREYTKKMLKIFEANMNFDLFLKHTT